MNDTIELLMKIGLYEHQATQLVKNIAEDSFNASKNTNSDFISWWNVQIQKNINLN